MTGASTGPIYHTYRTRTGDEEGHNPKRPWVVAYMDEERMTVVSRHADGDGAFRASSARHGRELVDHDGSPLVTVPQAADMLGLSYQGANDLLRRRGIEPVDRVGNTRRYRQDAVDRLAAEERHSGRPKTSQPPAGGASTEER